MTPNFTEVELVWSRNTNISDGLEVSDVNIDLIIWREKYMEYREETSCQISEIYILRTNR